MSVKRDEYVETMKQQLDDWNSEIDKLEAKGEEAKGEAQKKYNAQIDDLRQKLHTVQNKLEELESTGKDRWEQFVAELENVRDAFVHSFNYFKSQL